MAFGAPSSRLRGISTWWAPPVALGLVVATFALRGFDANAVAWAVVQMTLVALAAYDFKTRRLPNAITIPGAVVVLGLRAAFERSELGEVVAAGVLAFALFFVIGLATRGGLGMGDVKLAGLLGFVLGSAVLPALLIGTLAGGVASLALVARSRAGFRTHIAYGPYLALGGAVGILAFHPPSLV